MIIINIIIIIDHIVLFYYHFEFLIATMTTRLLKPNVIELIYAMMRERERAREGMKVESV